MRRTKSTYDDLMAELAEARKVVEHLEGVIAIMFPTAPTDEAQSGVVEPPPPLPYGVHTTSRADRVLKIVESMPGVVVSLNDVALRLQQEQHPADADKDDEFLRRKVGRVFSNAPHLYKRVARGTYEYQGPSSSETDA